MVEITQTIQVLTFLASLVLMYLNKRVVWFETAALLLLLLLSIIFSVTPAFSSYIATCGCDIFLLCNIVDLFFFFYNLEG